MFIPLTDYNHEMKCSFCSGTTFKVFHRVSDMSSEEAQAKFNKDKALTENKVWGTVQLPQAQAHGLKLICQDCARPTTLSIEVKPVLEIHGSLIDS